MINLIKSITKSEWKLIFLVTVIVIILTQLPVVFGYLNSTSEKAYIGIHSQTSVDILVYFSYIKQIMGNKFLLLDNFTGEMQDYGTFNIVWFLVGLLGRALGLTPGIAFHLARAILAPFLLITVYIFLSYVFEDKFRRRLGFIFISFASGLGFYLFPLFLSGFYDPNNFFRQAWWPHDLSQPEISIFNTIYQSPHFILSWICTLWIFLFALLAFEKRRPSYGFYAGLIALAYFNFHPYFIPLIFGVIGVYGVYYFLKHRLFDFNLLFGFIFGAVVASLSIGYHFFLLKNSYVISTRATQNVTLVFYLWPAIVGFGAQLPFAFLGFVWAYIRKELDDKFIFFTIWLLVSIILLFAPIQFQSRYFQGMQFPLVIFITYGLNLLWQYLKSNSNLSKIKFLVNPYLITLVFILLFCMSNIFNLFRDYYYCTNRLSLFYINRDALNGFNWLDQQPDKNKLVVAREYYGHLVPGFSGNKVYFAHGHETLFYDSKKIEVNNFFSSSTTQEKKYSWLLDRNISYIFDDMEDGTVVSRFESLPYLKKVFDAPKAKIYEVIKD